jgi:hypothetical protein
VFFSHKKTFFLIFAEEAGIPWRSDETTMEKVFLLMKLKFSHPQFRHETLPEKEVGVVIKLRWKVVVDGKVVVLQRPFRQTPSLSDVQIREAVAAYTLKKCPGLEPFERILMVLDKTNKCELAKEVSFYILCCFLCMNAKNRSV